MTDETQASGPERRRENPDRLHIAPASQKEATNYQWFAMSIMGKSRAEDVDRRIKDGCWEPVTRADMPAEFSGHEEFIQRSELRLFCRPQYLTDEAQLEDVERALGDIKHLGEVSYTPTSNAPPPNQAVRPRTWRYRPGSTARSVKLSVGRFMLLHEKPTAGQPYPSGWRRWAMDWYPVWLPRAEAEVASCMLLSKPEWAWAKIELRREGIIPWKY